MRKRIAVFTSIWSADYIYPLLQGLRRGARERGVDLYVFNSYGDSDVGHETFSKGEYDIFFLPDLREFDGALLVANNASGEFWINRLKQRIREAGLPCVGVEEQTDLDYTIGVDNYRAMYTMVEYLVREKHCRVLNYVGGPANHDESRLRKQAFLDVLERWGLPCDPRRMGDYHFVNEDGVQAYRDFKALGLECPDAVVCANDGMAVGYLKEAIRDGRSAPEDFLITGFDNTKQAQQFFPRITSVDRGREELGHSGVCFLDDLIEKRDCPPCRYVPFHVEAGQSTGDNMDSASYNLFRRELFDINARADRVRLELKHLRTALLGQNNLDQFRNIVSRSASQLDMKRFMMAVEPIQIQEDAKERWLFFGSWDGCPIRVTSRKDDSLIPGQWRREDGTSHTYLFAPCHCVGRQFGYWVAIDDFEVVWDNLLSEWMLALDISLDYLRQNLHLQSLNRELSGLYRRDSLTGLYNRFALKEMGEQLLQRNRKRGKSTLIIFVDMDSLKSANDLYGHDVGDLALRTIADAAKRICTDQMEFAVRYGGDEFLLLGNYLSPEDTRQIMENLEQSVTALGARRNIPFALTVSIGCAEIRADAAGDLEHHIRQADQQMYQRKMQKKLKKKGNTRLE